MQISGSRVLVTGGAGFIGSHITELLIGLGAHVTVFDNLSTGNMANIASVSDNPKLESVRGDALNIEQLRQVVQQPQVIFHLAANSDVSLGYQNTKIDFQQNVLATFNLLEAARTSGGQRTIIFASSSTVYGQARTIPTPENYGPLVPISLYGATKLACEALVAAYSHLFDMNFIILRLGNIVGARNTHGVIHDFIVKLSRNRTELEILGDGTQMKSYLYIDDCIEAIACILHKVGEENSIFNISNQDQASVLEIARIVQEEMGLKDSRFVFASGCGRGGWAGDVTDMLLDTTKLRKLGWRPKSNSKEAIRKAVCDIPCQRRRPH